jgi:hypothetical protein
MPGPFKKFRKNRLQTKIDKLNQKVDDLTGITKGYYKLPSWKEGGKKVVKFTKKILNLQDRLRKLNLGGKIKDIPGMYMGGTSDVFNKSIHDITQDYKRGDTYRDGGGHMSFRHGGAAGPNKVL